MALSALALCSRALLKIGAQPVASLDEGTAEAEVAANLYPAVRDALLSLFPWSFATAQATLPRLSARPTADFDHAFQLPVDFLRALSAGTPGSGRGLAYRILEDRLHCSAEQVVLSYIFRPAEAAFPPFFAAALATRLAAEFCIPLTENTSRAQLLLSQAEAELRAARQADSQQATPRAIENFPLLNARG
ncbi:hypothetical protein JYK14_23525 [Siccirubricoccus sp. KC 17139]|uniref:Uncharacterized protein n=1 Tax=Siccirubricoccus soli TaxID=2899147 RepID=A0ABT1DAZ1_9PROT|nr:hypothetical protein [Siccirubricoccus soli]MCO6419107.1 hypothetical protein [Siccirubricoccus soli]MCP2685242.1 hypothetical protein [Siccirubricoccus soli]